MGDWIRTKVKRSIAHNYIHNCCISSATDGLDAFSAANDAILIGAGTRSTATDESISQTSPVLLLVYMLLNLLVVLGLEKMQAQMGVCPARCCHPTLKVFEGC